MQLSQCEQRYLSDQLSQRILSLQAARCLSPLAMPIPQHPTLSRGVPQERL